VDGHAAEVGGLQVGYAASTRCGGFAAKRSLHWPLTGRLAGIPSVFTGDVETQVV